MCFSFGFPKKMIIILELLIIIIIKYGMSLGDTELKIFNLMRSRSNIEPRPYYTHYHLKGGNLNTKRSSPTGTELTGPSGRTRISGMAENVMWKGFFIIFFFLTFR